MKRCCIYTVITGDYDTIKTPRLLLPDTDYILFTNNRNIVNSDVWQILYLDESADNILLSRKVKMLPHKYLPQEYEISVYLDADMQICGDFGTLLSIVKSDTLMAVFRHSTCKSVQEEIRFLLDNGKVDKNIVEKQWRRYVQWGFKDDMGQTENGCLIRKHNNNEVVKLMELWWQEFQQGCRRDQVSFMPCVWRCGFQKLQIIEDNVWSNAYFKVLPHNKANNL